MTDPLMSALLAVIFGGRPDLRSGAGARPDRRATGGVPVAASAR
jgi:hypothetical protein